MGSTSRVWRLVKRRMCVSGLQMVCVVRPRAGWAFIANCHPFGCLDQLGPSLHTRPLQPLPSLPWSDHRARLATLGMCWWDYDSISWIYTLPKEPPCKEKNGRSSFYVIDLAILYERRRMHRHMYSICIHSKMQTSVMLVQSSLLILELVNFCDHPS